eukprot:Polyplicarium_translucidae@DN1926_c0_g1_i7.p1
MSVEAWQGAAVSSFSPRARAAVQVVFSRCATDSLGLRSRNVARSCRWVGTCHHATGAQYRTALCPQSLYPVSRCIWFVRVGKAEIAFADPIDVAKLPEDETLDSLKARVQKAMLAALRTCPSYDTAIESRINETPTSRGGGLRG